MKKIIAVLISGLLSLVSCTEYDEVAMWNKNEDMGARLAALEKLCSRMNTNITSLQQIVEALQDNDYVTGVAPVVENGRTIGYTISFSKSGPVTVYHGKEGQAGTAPVIGVRQDDDGLYYWTLDGAWLTDGAGGKIAAQGTSGKSAYELAVEKGYRGTLDEWLASLGGSDGKSAYELAVENGYGGTELEWLASLEGEDGDAGDAGVTPQLKIQDDYWYVSYGNEWVRLGKATGEEGQPGRDGDPMFSDIDTSDPDCVVLILAEDGTEIRLPCYQGKFDLQFDAEEIYCGTGETEKIPYTLIPADARVAVECISHSGYKVSVDKDNKELLVTAPVDPAEVEPESEILVFASDDERTVMRKLVVKQVKYITYKAGRKLGLNGGLDGDPRFRGENCRFIDERCCYDPATEEGKWAYTGVVTWVEPFAFWSESALRSIVLPEGIEVIGDNAFEASGLEEIVLPQTLTEIGENVFSRSALKEVIIPANVEKLGVSAFGSDSQNGSRLEKVVFEGTQIKTIEKLTFKNCKQLVFINLPESLERIEDNAFHTCSALKKIEIPDRVTHIGEGAFVSCTALTDLVIGDGIIEIEPKAFAKCTALETVTIGKSIQRIGTNAFDGCLGLKTVVCPSETPAELGKRAFPVSDGRNYTADYKIYVPDAVVEIYKDEWPDYWSAPYPFQITKVIFPMSSMPQS